MSFASVFSRFRAVPPRRVSAPTIRPAAIFWTFLLGTAACLPGALHAANPGDLDSSFLSVEIGTTVFSVALEDTSVVTLDLTEDTEQETVILGGDVGAFETLTNIGGYQPSFTFPVFGNPDRIVYTAVPELVPLNSGTHNILLGGLFGKTKVDKVITPSRNILRTTLDGVIDTTFNANGNGANDNVLAILPQTDGSMIAAGQFTSYDDLTYPRIIKLNPDGGVDTNFASVPVSDGVYTLAPQVDPASGTLNGQILFGGTFSSIGSGNYTKLARVDQLGNLDTSFKPVIDERVLAAVTQPDGKIVIGGQFSTVNGTAVGHLARLNPDGSLDATFNASVSGVPPQTSNPVAVYTLKLLPYGRLYVGGNFTTIDGAPRQYLGLIETDGSLNTGFDPGTNITNSVQSVAVQADYGVLVGETVSKKINNVFPASLIRLFGDPEPTLNLPTISLAVTKPKARARVSGASDTGVFKLFRTGGDLTQPQTVYFEVSGTAQSGVAYKAFPRPYTPSIYQATFPANTPGIKVKVKPLVHNAMDSPETVTITLLPSQSASDFYLTTGGRITGTVSVFNTD